LVCSQLVCVDWYCISVENCIGCC